MKDIELFQTLSEELGTDHQKLLYILGNESVILDISQNQQELTREQ